MTKQKAKYKLELKKFKNDVRIANYTYDAWGNILSITNQYGQDVTDQPRHQGNLNPIRYRGYHYDAEIGLHWLATRFYDPQTGRFINSDGQLNGGMLGNNLYAYCSNDPVNSCDCTGTCAHTAGMFDCGYCEKAKLEQEDSAKKDPKDSPPDHPDFKSPKKGDRKVKNPNGQGTGWETKDGGVWVWTPRMHGGEGWTVQYPGGDHSHAYPGGKVRNYFDPVQSTGSSAMIFVGAAASLWIILNDLSGVGFADNVLLAGSSAFFVGGMGTEEVCSVCGEERYSFGY